MRYTSQVHLKKPSKKAIYFERKVTYEDALRLIDAYNRFAIEADFPIQNDMEIDELKADLEDAFEPETLFTALESEVGAGYVLGVLFTFRFMREEGLLKQNFELIED